MNDHFGPIEVSIEDDVFLIKIGELNGDSHAGLIQAFRAAYDSDTRVVVLTGKNRTFLDPSKYDTKWLQTFKDHEVLTEVMGEAEQIIKSQLNVEKPMIAKVHSPGAHSLGASLALACDIIVASKDATFSDPHCPGFGVPPGDGGALLWPLRIGLGRAKEFLLTDQKLTAEEAEDIGLINRAVPDENIDEEVDQLVDELASQSQPGLRATKKWLNQYLDHYMTVVGMGTASAEGFVASGPGFSEALDALDEGREPDFS